MAYALLVGVAVFLAGIALAGTFFGIAWSVLNMWDRRTEKVTVSDIQRRLSHEKPTRPLTVHDALAEKPAHRECSVARCHKKRAINRTLAANRQREADSRPDPVD
ncbi:hypothetical protein [Nocardia brasiliensis]|uniref:hypothetical protein n=1 Tax=Nocardia brasiliensis TaxID=37326 RepID=UPI0024584770|nr:hypothetical protein [Nocardia brasiliensis]